MSMLVAFSDVAKRDASAVYPEDFIIKRVSTDTRTLQPGDTYLALAGDRFDGHDYINTAIEAGASSVVVSKDTDVNVAVLKVDNTLHTLGVIARLYRDQLNAIVFAITGSNGKTSVKGMLTSVCERAGKTTSTIANNNNQIGVPLTLLSASREDQYLVVEAGTSEQGEIEKLVNIINPDVVVITNVSESHLDGLGSRDAVFEEKSNLISGSRENAQVVVNMDDSYSAKATDLADKRSVITYGFSDQADIHSVERDGVQVEHGDRHYSFSLQVPGKHNLSNAMATIAMAECANISMADIQTGLESYAGTNGRLQVKRLGTDNLLIDDTYNANPASSFAALDVLGSYKGRKLFAYGGMAELGNQSVEMHRSVGRKADEVHVNQLYVYGDEARPVYDAFSGEKYFFDEIDELSSSLASHMKPGDTVLVKGSRRYRMERVNNYLLERVA